MAKIENLVNGPVARKLLGAPGPAIGRTRFSALKRVLGLTGRYVPVDKMQEYLGEHPNFSEREIYVRKSRRNIPASPRALAGRKSGERLSKHV
jgi:hypothetical protein